MVKVPAKEWRVKNRVDDNLLSKLKWSKWDGNNILKKFADTNQE